MEWIKQNFLTIALAVVFTLLVFKIIIPNSSENGSNEEPDCSKYKKVTVSQLPVGCYTYFDLRIRGY